MALSSKDTGIVKKITSTLDSLIQTPGIESLSALELDLIRESLRRMYTQLDDLEGVEQMQIQEPSREVVFKINQEEGISSETVDEHIHETESEDSEIEFEQLIPDIPAEIKAAAEEPEKNKEQKSTEENPSGLDLFTSPDTAEEPVRVIDKISGSPEEESVAEKLQKKSKIETLKEAIGINEKFFFINELFDGSLTEYNNAIDLLDQQQSLEEALVTMEDLVQKYSWQGKQEALDQLKQFIRLKFK